MSLVPIGGKLHLAEATPNIDNKYGPYSSIDAAWAALGPAGDNVACIGLTVGIQATSTSPVVEYWFKDACAAKTDLVLRIEVEEANKDGKKYVRKDGAWVEFVDEDTKDFEQLTNRPKYNGSTMDKNTDIPEVKTTAWDNKQDAITSTTKLSADLVGDGTTNKVVTQTEKTGWNAKLDDAPSDTKKYVRKDGAWVEFVDEDTKDFELLSNRPKYNGSTMDKNTDIPEVKTTAWDAKSVVSVSSTGTATDSIKYITIDNTEKKIAGSEVSGTHNDTANWKTITIDGVTKNIPSGGGAGSEVVPNVELTGNETRLKSLEVDGTAFDLDEGLENVTISIMGDSISTFKHWIPNSETNGTNTHHVWRPLADGTLEDTGIVDDVTLQHDCFYFGTNCGISSVTQTWWHQLIYKELKARMGTNASWSGSFIGNNKDTDTGTTTSSVGNATGPNTCMASVTRIKRLAANGDPDIILYYGGTNDLGNGAPGLTLPNASNSASLFNANTDYTTVDLTTTKWAYFIDAFRVSLQRMQYFYPKAKIVVLLPTYCTSYYNRANLNYTIDLMKKVCDYFGINYIDLRGCGISISNLQSGNNAKGVQTFGDGSIHPNPLGMEMIAKYIKRKLLTILDRKFDAKPVYNVTNSSGLHSDVPYIIGVTQGSSYTTTLTGTNFGDAIVTMGGTDITAGSYNTTTGVVTIGSVTGDIVISMGQHQITHVTGVTLNSNSETLSEGDSVTLTATVAPANADDTSVTWTCSDVEAETVWYTANATSARSNNALPQYAGFSYTDTYKGTETNGSKLNKVRFIYGGLASGATTATLTVGVCSQDKKTIVSSEVLTLDTIPAGGTLVELDTVNTYQLENNQHFFVGAKTDTILFRYTETGAAVVANFNNRVGTSTIAGGGGTQNLGVDFGYLSSDAKVSITPNGNTCVVQGINAGSATVTATTTDGGFTATCDITVSHVIVLSSIEVTTPPTTVNYAVGESFNPAGMVVTAHYDDNTSDTISAGEYTYLPATLSTAGPTNITISWTYQGVTKTCTQAVTVYALDGISVLTQPTKTTYMETETFSPAGMIIGGSYGAAGSRNIADYTYAPMGALELTDTQITISYAGFSCTQAITVTEWVGTRWITPNQWETLAVTPSAESLITYGPFFYTGTDNGSRSSTTYKDVNALFANKKVNIVKFKAAKAGTLTVGIATYDALGTGFIGQTTGNTADNWASHEVITVTSDMVGTWVEIPFRTVTLSEGQQPTIQGSTDTGRFSFIPNGNWKSAFDNGGSGWTMYNHVAWSSSGTSTRVKDEASCGLCIDWGYDAAYDTYVDIATTVVNGTYSGDTYIDTNGGTAEVTIIPDTGYVLPNTITVTNASYTYNPITGVVSLSDATNNVTIAVTCPLDTITWHTAHINDNPTKGNYANLTFAGFSYSDSYKGTEANGAKMNCVRFILHQAGTITVGKVSSDRKTIVDSETLNITGSAGDFIVVTTAKTYTLENGEHFFINKQDDTGMFKYCYNTPAPTVLANFWCYVGYSNVAELGTNQNLSVDFGYDSSAETEDPTSPIVGIGQADYMTLTE